MDPYGEEVYRQARKPWPCSRKTKIILLFILFPCLRQETYSETHNSDSFRFAQEIIKCF